ncbi:MULTISPECIES: ZIP family metal transporter [Coprobacillaceae]|uniref:ZIP family metal transporter n=1 Tax=Coprobacillaceae TaxID=2810280 RepID=UPI000E4C648A|nr:MULTISPECIES: ZIP family metal transporter [Coprobacillaceae]RHM60885.1 ZIP family metal transporter [Coprobacillus sp. AF33-1AC]RHS94500.1 ZIP family metal transporter [Erysipelatoclostridium sp. AM42-17]
MKPILYALLGTMFTFMCTTIGSALVYLFKGEVKLSYQQLFLGFAAGVMIAASVWSLLIPSKDMAQSLGQIEWLVLSGGFITGAIFLLLLDHIIPHQHLGEDQPEGLHAMLGKNTMLVLAVTLHNIPEGMAVGLTFAIACQTGSISLASALALALGIGLQNLPEGAAISLPLKQEGMSNHKAFIMGSLSGIVEPIAGTLTAMSIQLMQTVLPFLLSFAAGAMMYVVVEELIPEAQLGKHSHIGTFGVLSGFVIMMLMDIFLS